MILPDPPADRNSAAEHLWLAVFDRWLTGAEQRHAADVEAATVRWAAERRQKGIDT